MNITKRKNHYQVREMRNGKVFTYTFDYKPSKLEAQTKLNELESRSFSVKKTILNAMYEYLDVKKNILSPSSYASYLRIIHQLEREHKNFCNTDINKITKFEMQKFVNELAKKIKGKTIKNIYGFISISLKMFSDYNIKISLPKDMIVEPYIPTDEEVSLLIQESKGTQYHIPIRLAIYSLRLSEILGLTLDDVYDDYVYVRRAKVRGIGGAYIKTTKTKNSTRKVYVDKELIDLIRKQGYIYNGRYQNITEFITSFCKRHNIQKFTLHKLRHYFATSMHYANIPRKAIEKMGGWSGSSPVLERIYTHSKNDYDYQNEVQVVMSKLKRS